MKTNDMTYVYDRRLGKHVWKDRRSGMTGQGLDIYGIKKRITGSAVLTFDGAGVAPVSNLTDMMGQVNPSQFQKQVTDDVGSEISRQLQQKLNFTGRIDKLIKGKSVMIM